MVEFKLCAYAMQAWSPNNFYLLRYVCAAYTNNDMHAAFETFENDFRCWVFSTAGYLTHTIAMHTEIESEWKQRNCAYIFFSFKY